jgi:hypothetical protein
MEGEILLFLSTRSLKPFAWPLPRSARFFVAISNDAAGPPNRIRNVIAHELGHVVGLRHNDDPSSLMCMPCPASTERDDAAFSPLTASERSRLIELYAGPASN